MSSPRPHPPSDESGPPDPGRCARRSANPLLGSELRAAVAALVALLAVGWLGLTAIGEHTDILYDDFRQWRLSAPGRDVPRSFFTRLQPAGSQRPLRLVLKLDRIPQAGDRVVAKRTYRVDPEGVYCFDVFMQSDYHNPESQYARNALRSGVRVNSQRVAWVPIADRKLADPVAVHGIRAPKGRVHVTFEVRAMATREKPSWQRASEVRFELARLYRCGSKK